MLLLLPQMQQQGMLWSRHCRESFNESGLALNNAEVSHQDQPSQGSEQDEQLHGGNNIAQVIVETDDMDNEATQLSVDSPDNSVGVSVFA